MKGSVREKWTTGDALWWDATRDEFTNVAPPRQRATTQRFTFWSWVRAAAILVVFGVLYLVAIEGLEVLAWLIGGA